MSDLRLIKAVGATIKTYPYSVRLLKRENPNTSFTKDTTAAQLAEFNVFHVTEAAKPAYDETTHTVRPKAQPAIVNGEWVHDWVVRLLTSDELSTALNRKKRFKIAELKAEGLSRIQAVLPGVTDWDALDLVSEHFLSIAPAARQPTVKFQLLIDVTQAGKTAGVSINAMTDGTAIDAYDVVNGPSWPT